jgi:capsular exopolysaccharide synthesis family protein
LTGKVSLKDAIQKTSVENIWLLPSGVIPPNPSELLNSKKMKEMMEKVKEAFDVILLDTAPVLAVIDAVIVSSLADSVVFIIKAGEVARKPFLNAVEDLRRAKAKIIGVLFNELKVRRGDYHFMDYYRYYRHGYYGEEEKQVKSKK